MSSNLKQQPNFRPETDRYQVLLELADLMVHHRNLPELFHEMAQTLQKVIAFDFIAFSLHDPTSNTMRLHLWEGGDTAPVPAQVPVEDSASGWVWQNQLPMIFEDLRQETRFPRTLDMLREHGNRSYVLLPLTTAQKKLGALGFGSSRESAYETADLQLMERVADLSCVGGGKCAHPASFARRERAAAGVAGNQQCPGVAPGSGSIDSCGWRTHSSESQ